MKSKKNSTLENRIAKRVARTKKDVLLRRDFKDLGGYDQVGRVLRRLVAKGELVKVGYGLYARAAVSPLSGKPIPTKSLPAIATEALKRLNVEMTLSSSAQAYNVGITTSVPTGRVIAVKDSRISRKIGYDGKYVIYERSS